MRRFKLEDFSREVKVDCPSLREEILTLRKRRSFGMAAKGGEIGPTTWSKWRTNARAVKGAQSIDQRQAVIVLYQACFSFSGKFVSKRMFKDIALHEWASLTDAWLEEVSDIHIERVLTWIHSIALTPGQVIELLDEGKDHGKKSMSFRSLQRIARRQGERLVGDRPVTQKFLRSVFKQTILKPMPK